MSPVLRLALTLLLAAMPALAGPKPKVVFKTSAGSFTLELDPEAAPKTVENFLGYVNSGFYKGLVFHRVIRDGIIQGGGFTSEMKEKLGGPSIPNEAKQALGKGLKNTRGTIAMARTWIPDSAKAQFFINTVNNAPKYDPPAPDGYGYCVFGRVVAGMDVVDKIRTAKTTIRNGMRDVPVKLVVILDTTEVKAKASPKKKQ